MLVRVTTFWCILSGLAVAAPAIDDFFVGTWRDDASDPAVRIVFKPDHSVVVQGGELLPTVLQGHWEIVEGELFISKVKLAGKPFPEGECSQRIVSATDEKIVLQGTDSGGTSATTTYTRVR